MELYQLFKIQEIIERNIKTLAQIEEDALGRDNTFDLRFLALQIKTAEIANLTKCYKYSKAKENIPKEKMFVRYIDAMKFLLSIGNIHNFNIIDKDAISMVEEEESLVKLFSSIFDQISLLKNNILNDNYFTSLTIYVNLFARYVHLAKNLGFTFDEVYEYYRKHYVIEE
ncbi:dUTP diphosphatase [Alkaliphilus sp. MSJ-5]|uniref:dUTP diphosphatase n=1 Tax=Alkaliphilus flagellatus TaxID=2841507 RepID=A0ABS6G3Q7_9FIRM|nr:dUTP diphosphatase [Alkaliphilus flagellatus]MBU5677120.1 dUTP diphosphatase [Alkaliphilus flagellatus]